MFCHLAHTLTKGGLKAQAEPTKTVHEAVQAVADLEEVSEIFAAAITKQLSILVAIEYDQVNLDSPLGDFGILISYRNRTKELSR